MEFVGRFIPGRSIAGQGRFGRAGFAHHQDVAAKALDLMAAVVGTDRADELIAAVYNLDSFGPVSGLRRLLQA